MVEDLSGNFWIGTSAGLHRYNKSTGALHRCADEPKYANTLLAGLIRSLLIDSNGIIWIGTRKGLAAFDPVKGVVEDFSSNRYAPKSIFQSACLPLYEDEKGLVWFGSSDSLFAYDRTSGRFENISLPVPSGKTTVMVVYRDHKGIYWIGTSQYGLYATNDLHSTWRSFRHDSNNPRSISDNTVRCISEDNDGNVWIGTLYGGVNIFDRATGLFTRFTPTGDGKSDARYEGVNQIYRDRSGLLWAGYDGSGLVKINPYRNKFQHFLLPSSAGKKTGDNFFKSVMQDQSGLLWLGTYDQGVVVFDRKSGAVTRYSHHPHDPNSLGSNTVVAIFQDHAKRIWLGTREGLDEFDAASHRFHHHDLPVPFTNDPRANIIASLCKDSSGILWVGTPLGLFSLNTGTGRFELESSFPQKNEKGEEISILCIVPHPGGSLLVGTLGSGFCEFDPHKKTVQWHRSNSSDLNSLSNNSIKTICLGEKNVLWLGTENGLNRFDLNEGTCRRYYVNDGLPNDFIYGILMDDHAHLWISTNKGLSRMDARDYLHPEFRNYTPNDGLQSYEFNTGVYCNLKDGEMLFGGVNGFNIFHPDSVFNNPNIPQVVLTGFKKFNQPFDFGGELNLFKELSLNFTESEFSFEFAALEFTSPLQNQYAYRMEGFDKEWIYCGSRREARYTNLDPGHYTFHVKGSNNDGLWNEQGASIGVVITPPFWRTWWAYSMYAALLVSGGIGTRWLVNNWKIIIASRKAKHVSHYRLLEQLGAGGMGKVYRAADINTKKIVALKVLHQELLKDPENRKRLASEGRLLSSFSHSNIVKVFETGETEQRGFIAMEYLPGGTVKQYLEASFPLPVQEIKRIALQICHGLEEIHSHGIIHRDIKTSNIMLDDEKNIRIMDFGLSKSPLVSTMTTLGTVIGTLGYVAPEQVTNLNVSHRVDIFSFGVVLYELLTNQLPFKGENEIAVIHSIFNTVPPPPSILQSSLPKSIDSIVVRCLEKNPEQRFGSIADVRIALDKEFW